MTVHFSLAIVLKELNYSSTLHGMLLANYVMLCTLCIY